MKLGFKEVRSSELPDKNDIRIRRAGFDKLTEEERREELERIRRSIENQEEELTEARRALRGW